VLSVAGVLSIGALSIGVLSVAGVDDSVASLLLGADSGADSVGVVTSVVADTAVAVLSVFEVADSVTAGVLGASAAADSAVAPARGSAPVTEAET
jgi:hypothetical protein